MCGGRWLSATVNEWGVSGCAVPQLMSKGRMEVQWDREG